MQTQFWRSMQDRSFYIIFAAVRANMENLSSPVRGIYIVCSTHHRIRFTIQKIILASVLGVQK